MAHSAAVESCSRSGKSGEEWKHAFDVCLLQGPVSVILVDVNVKLQEFHIIRQQRPPGISAAVQIHCSSPRLRVRRLHLTVVTPPAF